MSEETPEVKTTQTPSLTISRIYTTWLPLVASWLLMAVELPAINAVVARLGNPEIMAGLFTRFH